MIAGCLLLHLRCVCMCMRTFAIILLTLSTICVTDFFPVLHCFTLRLQLGKKRFLLHAYTHFNWSFEVVPNYSRLFCAQSFSFYRVRCFLSPVSTSIAWKCCSDCHFEHFIGFRNSDCMQTPFFRFRFRFRRFVNTNNELGSLNACWISISSFDWASTNVWRDYTKEILIIVHILIRQFMGQRGRERPKRQHELSTTRAIHINTHRQINK